jgi:hypothetical protein
MLLNQECELKNEYRLRIAEPLKGLADIELYNKWKTESPEKYEEVNNLVYQIKHNIHRFPRFDNFSWDLWGYDFIAAESPKFPADVVEEQLKLINILLGTKYWIDISELTDR